MNASLTLTGSIAALTAALQAFERVDGEPDAGTRTVTPLTPVNSTLSRAIDHALAADAGNSPAVTQTASIDTGTGTPAPMPLPSVPSGVASTPIAPIPSTLPDSTDSEDDEEGEPSDGSGVDAEGLPWDERIHSSSKKKTAKGLWAARKGGPKGDALAAIKDELRGVTQVPMPLPVPVAAPAPVVPPMPPVMPASVEPVAAPAPMPQPVPTPMPAPTPMPVPVEPVAAPAPMPTPAPAATEEWDFAKLMAQIGPKMGSVITPDYLAQVCQHYGIGAITDTATKPELIGQLVAQFQADGRW